MEGMVRFECFLNHEEEKNAMKAARVMGCKKMTKYSITKFAIRMLIENAEQKAGETNGRE